ncbi:hypothetical protein [Paenibacillus aceris]|nr:hypothetical protein [Paenibacillus aceris]
MKVGAGCSRALGSGAAHRGVAHGALSLFCDANVVSLLVLLSLAL